jgi:hypothetical protein
MVGSTPTRFRQRLTQNLGLAKSAAPEYALSMRKEVSTHVFERTACLFLGTLLCTTFLAQAVNSKERSPREEPSSPIVWPLASVRSESSDEKSPSKSNIPIPPGTILPVRLNQTVSSAKCKPGQVITGRIMQDIPLSLGVRIRAGGEVMGHVIEVSAATNGAKARISLQFDKLVFSHQTISITTNLRAIAGFMQVIEAQTPPIGAGESEVFRWLTTVQVGGDVVYGSGGPVTSGDNSQTVGKQVNGGVLSQVRAKEGTKCRGAIDSNDNPQALWVFSSDACGTYGLEHIDIEHAGRTDPTGVIVLTSDSGDLKIPAGAGMLLRVNANGHS